MKKASDAVDPYIQALLNRDAKGIERIYTDFGGPIAAFVRKNGGNTTDAKDIMQDALLIIWNKASAPDFVLTSSFYSYLLGICRNLWLRKRKKKDNNTVTLSAVEGYKDESSFIEAFEQKERQQLFMLHFSRLGDRCQLILRLFFQGKSMDAIAKSLQIENAHAARNQKYRCQKKLENAILNDPSYNEVK